MKTKKEIAVTKHVETQLAANDTLLSEGDRRAVGAIAVALGKSLIEEARTVLVGLDGEAEDVVQDFLVFLLAAKGPFNRANGPAMQWLFRMVRTIAQQRRREWKRFREPPDDDVA